MPYPSIMRWNVVFQPQRGEKMAQKQDKPEPISSFLAPLCGQMNRGNGYAIL